MTNQDIQVLHMQNNAYRDLILSLKEKINQYDRQIRANEREIGLQLEDMAATERSEDCTLCMDECNVTESKPIDQLLQEDF